MLKLNKSCYYSTLAVAIKFLVLLSDSLYVPVKVDRMMVNHLYCCLLLLYQNTARQENFNIYFLLQYFVSLGSQVIRVHSLLVIPTRMMYHEGKYLLR